ncbi:MAG: succinylglutamate desuccinylase/aspartoacylase family protein [Candidatus Adiutrix sp.]|nr:succinylglutamate desuccinylase/aspartoacylase family protein [Candidatus Adiutrix sp.]
MFNFRTSLRAWIPALLLLLAWPLTAGAAQAAPASRADRQHLVFWAGTPQEIEVYKIFGRLEGPTVMIMGGIQGNEPGGYMSADLYADLALRRGNLIVVPRANFKSVVMAHRGPDGDMNRKFEGDLSHDPDQHIVEVLKGLMAESDLLLNLHDGSGFYRPTWESEQANPSRYGQCVIADAEIFVNPKTGQNIPLGEYAQEVVERVNFEIDEEKYKFHFFNTNTGATDSRYQEQRKSATYYALTQVGIPAFGIETSKSLPSLEMKIYQHNLAVNAFLDIFGVEIEQPRITLDPPEMGYAVISVNDTLPIAVADGQTLQVAPGDAIEVVHVGANYDRGLSVDVLALGGLNDIRKPLRIEKPTAIEVKKDDRKIGRIQIALLPPDQSGASPRLVGTAKARPPKVPTPGKTTVAAVDPAVTAPRPAGPVATDPVSTEPTSQVRGTISRPDAASEPAVTTTPVAAPPKTVTPPAASAPVASLPTKITGFVIEIDGQRVELAVGQEMDVLVGAEVKMVELVGEGKLGGIVMNLKGFVPQSKQYKNDGEDKGFTADTGRDMMSAFSVQRKGLVYEINAERGKDILASCALRLVKPKLAQVTLEVNGETRTLKLGGVISIAPGTPVTVTKITLDGGRTLTSPRYTLGGKSFSSQLPQTLSMPTFAANLAVFNGSALAGKVMWSPR